MVKGKEEVSWFKPQLDEHASSTMPTDVAAGLSVLKLLLDFRELLFAQKPRMQETLKHGPSTCPTSQGHATTSSAPKKNSFRKIGRQLEDHTEQECFKLSSDIEALF